MNVLTIVTIVSLIAAVLSIGTLFFNAVQARNFRKNLERKGSIVTIETTAGKTIEIHLRDKSKKGVKEFTESVNELLHG